MISIIYCLRLASRSEIQDNADPDSDTNNDKAREGQQSNNPCLSTIIPDDGNVELIDHIRMFTRKSKRNVECVLFRCEERYEDLGVELGDVLLGGRDRDSGGVGYARDLHDDGVVDDGNAFRTGDVEIDKVETDCPLSGGRTTQLLLDVIKEGELMWSAVSITHVKDGLSLSRGSYIIKSRGDYRLIR